MSAKVMYDGSIWNVNGYVSHEIRSMIPTKQIKINCGGIYKTVPAGSLKPISPFNCTEREYHGDGLNFLNTESNKKSKNNIPISETKTSSFTSKNSEKKVASKSREKSSQSAKNDSVRVKHNGVICILEGYNKDTFLDACYKRGRKPLVTVRHMLEKIPGIKITDLSLPSDNE